VSLLIVKTWPKTAALVAPEVYAAILVYADERHLYVHKPRESPTDAPEVVDIDLRTHRVTISSTAGGRD
jgi:hypothetical protein